MEFAQTQQASKSVLPDIRDRISRKNRRNTILSIAVIAISMLAIGSILGALVTASRAQPTFGFLVCLPFAVALSALLLALASSFMWFAVCMTLLGLSTQLLTISTFTFIQLSTAKAFRGRVMAIALATMMGSTALGAPLVGWVADEFGARWSIGLGCVSAMSAFLIGTLYWRVVYQPKLLSQGL